MKGQGQGEIYSQSLYSGFPVGALSLEEEGKVACQVGRILGYLAHNLLLLMG